MFDLEEERGAISHAEYVNNWKSAMQEAYSLASKSIMASAMKGKKNYDYRVGSSALQAGDRVLVRNLTHRGAPGKLGRPDSSDHCKKGGGEPSEQPVQINNFLFKLLHCCTKKRKKRETFPRCI